MRSAVSLVTLAFVVAVAVAAAAEAPGWRPAETATTGQSYFGGVKLVTDGDSNALATWEGGDGRLYTAFRAGSSGRWGMQHVAVSSGGPVPGRDSALAVNRRGQAVILTRQGVMRLADLSKGTLSRAKALPVQASGSPKVAIDDAGNVTIAWQRADGRRAEVLAVRGSVSTGRWGKPIALARRGAEEPQLALDSSGGAIVTWTRCRERKHFCGDSSESGAMDSPGPTPYRIEVRRRARVSGAWGRTLGHNVSLLHLIGTTRQRGVAPDKAGDAVVVWLDQGTGPQWKVRVLASTLAPRARAWTTTDVVASGEAWDLDYLETTSNERGGVLATWAGETRGGSAVRPDAGGGWRPLPLPADASWDITLADDGSTYGVGVGCRQGDLIAVGAVRSADSANWIRSDLNAPQRQGCHGAWECLNCTAVIAGTGSTGALAVWTYIVSTSKGDTMQAARYVRGP